jgi:hypothetical protein
LCVSIDCECDKGPGWRSQRPLAFAGVTDGIARRLQPLFRAHRAKATYLLSPELFGDVRAVDTLATLEGSAELGTHLHGEFAEPGAFEPEVTKAFQRDYPADVERAKMTTLTQAFARAFGRAPRSFRAGRFGVGAHSLGILEDLGYAVESSVTPFVEWSSAGAPDLSFVGAPTQPYHPDRRDPGRVGESPLLEVPLTILPRAAQSLPIVGRHVEARWLRPTRGTREGLVKIAQDAILRETRALPRGASPSKPIVLNAMFHNVEVIPGASPYADTEEDAAAILGRLGALLDFAKKEGFPVVGLADLPEALAEARA